MPDPRLSTPSAKTVDPEKFSATGKLALEIMESYYEDPLGFVRDCYPWGEPGTLANETGPDEWQAEVLTEIGKQVKKRGFNGSTPVAPLRVAISSGHGTGKSTLAAWLTNWIMSTRPNAQGTVTANTYKQLETKTWASVVKWTKLCVTRDWFDVGGDSLHRKDSKESWFCTPQTCREDNSEAFAGQHEASSTSFYIFDESSSIPHSIFEVAEGGLTDGEPMIFLFGNATKNSGDFYEAVFGSKRGRWIHRTIDSRNCKKANKELIAEWLELHGEDSDFFRVRVRGLAPAASDAQFIDLQRIHDAQERDVHVQGTEPLIAGCDLAWGGDDDNVIRLRMGKDARSWPVVRIPGEKTRDPNVLVTRLADILSKDYTAKINGVAVSKKIHTMFIDSAGIAGNVTPKLHALGFRNVIEINFGGDSPSIKYRYARDYMWGRAKDWLLEGAIDRDSELETDLSGPGYFITDKDTKIQLESKKTMKKRGCDSPDDGDALALTFAREVNVEPEKSSDEFISYGYGIPPEQRWLA